MAANQGNIELVTQPSGTVAPSCAHGPTLLFERYDQSSKSLRHFYACSAFRDKKVCSFHQWADEPGSKHDVAETNLYSHKEHRTRFHTFRKLPRPKRHVCCTCGLLLLPGETIEHDRKGHSIKTSVSLKQLKKPSFLFTPLDNNKTYAQYLFSTKSVNFLLSSLERLNLTHVLCVGTPRIHEEIQLRRKTQESPFTSMLLDFDERYAQLYPPALYAKYNMFNHHFFEPAGKKRLRQFLTQSPERLVVLTDPPFGGMVEALTQSFRKIVRMWRKLNKKHTSQSGLVDNKDFPVPWVWIFPYFMEKRICDSLPSLSMMDYKVDYDNHNLFNSQHKKKGSPVRIFTNISAANFQLPEEEGYWFCDVCQRFSAKENLHCKECGTCPSKDGTTYTHCDMCERCVKPSRFHCFKCGICVMQDHRCGQIVSGGCHICGETGHKRRECPQRHKSTAVKKRPLKRQNSSPHNEQGKKQKKELCSS